MQSTVNYSIQKGADTFKFLMEPQNPRTTPTKAMMNILLGSDNSCTTPFEILFFIWSPSWWRYIVGGLLFEKRYESNFVCPTKVGDASL